MQMVEQIAALNTQLTTPTLAVMAACHTLSSRCHFFCKIFIVERPALAVRLDLSFRSVYFFFSGNIFPTAEPISTKVCTVTASGQE